ncbi:Heg1 [Phodopus roborovskii]|uniref:Heg1 protein n=1 Tax=Phodopus roborovskii TaxID=109678 RepID=A0AAU9ZLT6_PHORO|nr:Heg1 [Phodopus roborovskii]
MASPRAPRWPPPPPPPLLLLLLLLLLPPPATPGARGPLLFPANRALLPAAGPPSPPGLGHTAPGPGVTTRRGRSGRVPRGVRAALESLSQSPSSSRSEGRISSSQIQSGIFPGLLERVREHPGEGTVHTQVAGTWVSSQASLPALELGESTMLSPKRSSSGQEHSRQQFSWTQSRPPPSDHSSSSGSIKNVNNSTDPQSPSVTQTKITHVTNTFANGVPRMLRSLTVSVEPINERESFHEHSRIAITSASVHSSPSVVDSRTDSRLTESLGDGEGIEPSTENGLGLPSIHWQSDSPTFGGHQLASSWELGNGSAIPLTETAFRSVPSIGGGESTGQWFPSESKTSTDTAESSDLHPDVGSTRGLTQFAHTAQQPRNGGSGLGGKSYSEPSSTSSSESLDSSAPHEGHSIPGLSYGQERGSDDEQRTSSGHTDHAYVSSAFTKGERALLSITENSSSSDTSESSTSSIKTSDSPYVDFSSSQAKGSNVSSYDGEPVQSSTESLVLHTSSLPSYTSTVNGSNNLVLDASTKSIEDPSDSGVPSPLPSAPQPHQFLSTLPSTRSPMQQLKSTSETATPSSSSLSPLPISLMVSTLAPHSVSQTDFPRSSSTLVPHRAREPRVTSVQMSTVESAIAVFPGNQTADPKNQSTPQQEKTITEAKSPSLVPLPTDPAKAVTMSLPAGTPWSPAFMGFPTEPALSDTSTTLARMSPALTSSVSHTTHAPVTSPNTPSMETLTSGTVVVHTTPEKQHQPTNPDILVPPTSPEGVVTTEGNQVHVDPTTPSIPLTTTPTSAEVTTKLSQAEEASPVSHFLRTSSPQTPDVSTAEILTSKYTTFAAQSTPESPAALSPPTPVNSCTVNPCLHAGECIVDLTGHGYRCVCPPAWQGDNCSVDVDECLSSPCPPLAMCNNTQGSFTCRCPVGYQLEKGICNLVRTFVTEFKLKKAFLNTTVENHSDIHEVENELAQTLNLCFSTLPGYIRSTVGVSREPSTLAISLQSTFALASNVTLFDLADGIQKYVNSCRSSAEVCQILGSQRRIFRAGSLCKRKSPECDRETSICTDLDGVALCQCKSGYFQFNKMDHSCRACEDGYRLENETCMSCPFGLGGLNCGNPYQLITVVIAAAGGGLLLILGIALIVTCCRKSKNDISKLIFKSGDFQMSPYAEYPKNPRSQEWGREAIEMHENGSTKNLLQMTDVYYSPTNVRNPELERNGLYPAYTGLPGSRHSCIFPGQYNPSFISDESRRRDYF